MSNVIDETGGLLSQIAVDEGVASHKADELLQQYENMVLMVYLQLSKS